MGSIYDNLIAGGAWKTILKGLQVTVEISIYGLALGTVLGAFFCYLRLSTFKVVSWTANIIISFMRGTPVVLLLMVIYYVVFKGIRIDSRIVAVVAFGLNSGAHIAEIMRAALEGVDKMQVEAMRMLGASRFMAFWYITIPQAVIIARPVYQNAIISLIQWTSVVGYIAITDLTRTVNSIGSRTGNPFFALFLGMLLYLLLSYTVNGIFKMTERKRRYV